MGGPGNHEGARGNCDDNTFLDVRRQAGCLVKICGITRLEDALEACRLGVWAIGLVFAPSPRQVSPGQAEDLVKQLRHLALGNSSGCEQGRSGRVPLVIGVFGEMPPAEIVQTVHQVGLDGVQLHGRQGPEAAEVRAALEASDEVAQRRVVILRAVPVDPNMEGKTELQTRVAKASPGADLLVLDTLAGAQFGGTGTAFRWDLAKQAGTDKPFLVAGGIGPSNVEEALVRSGAWGVDVSSGVEISPGVKDHQLMAELVLAAQACAVRKEKESK